MKRFLRGILALVAFLLPVFVPSAAQGITFGVPDHYDHPNVVSLRFVRTNLDSSQSCSGALIANDGEKYVFLTAAHCAQAELGGWNSVDPSTGSVGVSFDPTVCTAPVVPGPTTACNPPNDVDPADGGADGVVHVSGGVAFPHPYYRYPGQAGYNDRFDVAIVVFPVGATNSFGQTIQDRWGSVPAALTPATYPPSAGMELARVGAVDDLVASFANPERDLIFTAVGFGTQSSKSPQASGQGNKVKADTNDSFLNRNRTHVGFKKLNGYMLDVVVNTTQGDFGYLCPGDSGSPAIYEDGQGNQTILGVLTAGNCRSQGSYSRIDFPETKALLDCAYVPGDATAVAACVQEQFPAA